MRARVLMTCTVCWTAFHRSSGNVKLLLTRCQLYAFTMIQRLSSFARDVSFLLPFETAYLAIIQVMAVSYTSQSQLRSCHTFRKSADFLEAQKLQSFGLVSGLSSLGIRPAGASTPSPRSNKWMKRVLILAGF